MIWVHFQQTLLAGVGALLAAWITIRHIQRQIQQNEDHRRDGIDELRKELATSLLYRIMEASDDIIGINRKIVAMLSKIKDSKDDQLAPHASVIVPILGIPQNTIVYDPNELSLFHTSGENEFVMSVLEIINLRNILLTSVGKYNILRENISSESSRLANLKKHGDGLFGEYDLDQDEHPDLFLKIHSAESLVKQIIKMCNDGANLSRKIEKEFPKAVNKAFPDGDFTMTFHIPSEDEKAE
ncbi:MAG: hypothetical protein COA85_13775 [Robiginitomaculum sp.]|nr:MAG: hypothetical protein COA85_13775 [Robiginitomaculum sp.]